MFCPLCKISHLTPILFSPQTVLCYGSNLIQIQVSLTSFSAPRKLFFRSCSFFSSLFLWFLLGFTIVIPFSFCATVLSSWVCFWSYWVRCRRCLCFPLASVWVREARIFHAFINNVHVLVLLGALDDSMCFWWCENNLCIVSGWIFVSRDVEICYACLSELFFAQIGSSRLSEELSPKRGALA